MIAVQTNSGLSIVNMSAGEFLESIAKDGIDSSLVLAKRIIAADRNDWVHLARPVISDITCCFRKVGDNFVISTKKIESVKDLEFFIAPDGKQYSCEEAYRLEATAKVEQQEKEEEKEIPSEQVDLIPNPVIPPEVKFVPNPVVKSDEEEKVNENPIEEKNEPEKAELMVVEEKKLEPTEIAVQEPAQVAVREPVIEVKENQIKAAGALDNIVRDLPSIMNFPANFLTGIKNYIKMMGDEYKSHAEQYLRKCGSFHGDRESLKTDFSVPNALGSSKDMLDSLAVFPVYSRVLSRKNMDSRFVWNNMVNSTFMRVCPVGIMENQKIQCYVQEIKISSYDVREAEEMIKYDLKRENRKKRNLTVSEKYALMEQALEKIYNRKKGSLLACRDTVLVEDLDAHMDKLIAEKKVSYVPLYKWGQYDVVAYDVRERADEFPVPLLAQLQNLNGKPFQKEEMMGIDPMNPRIVKVPVVFTKSDNNALVENDQKYVEVSEMVLEEEQRESIVNTSEGLILEGYYYDKDTGNMISGQDFVHSLFDNISGVEDEETISQSWIDGDDEDLVPPGSFESEEEEDDLSSKFKVQNVTIGGTPISNEKVGEESDNSPIQPDIDVRDEDIIVAVDNKDRKLVDYIRPDGKYVGPDGYLYDSRDQYEVFMILSGDSFSIDDDGEKHR